MKRNAREGGLTLTGPQLYPKATILQTPWYWPRNRVADQWEKLGMQGTTVHDYSHLLLVQSKDSSFWDQKSRCTKNCLEQWKNSTTETRPRPPSYTLDQDHVRMGTWLKQKDWYYKQTKRARSSLPIRSMEKGRLHDWTRVRGHSLHHAKWVTSLTWN